MDGSKYEQYDILASTSLSNHMLPFSLLYCMYHRKDENINDKSNNIPELCKYNNTAVVATTMKPYTLS